MQETNDIHQPDLLNDDACGEKLRSIGDILGNYRSIGDKPAYLPPGDLDNLLSTIKNQKQVINMLIDALQTAADGLMDSVSQSEDPDNYLDAVRGITKVLAEVARL